MTDRQWDTLLKVVRFETVEPLPVGFIIDSPWLPGWCGMSILDYYTSDRLWLAANFRAIDTFPDVIFLPGFWSEYGMCTEPSAFGAKCTWEEANLPHAHKIIADPAEAGRVAKPDVRKDGLLPFMVNRLRHTEKEINDRGHRIRFAVSRGPLNIASFLMGSTEFLMALYTHAGECEKLLNTITDFTIDWIGVQLEAFPSIDGLLVLDDVVGFVGDTDYEQWAHPYLKRVYDAVPVTVKAFHNDAAGLVCAPRLADMGIILFNFSFEHSMTQMRALCGDSVAFLGNLPPRDVLALKSPEEIEVETAKMVDDLADTKGILFSCGGGMPQGVSTEQIQAFCEMLKSRKAEMLKWCKAEMVIRPIRRSRPTGQAAEE